eukprot:scaffold9519_cov183-Amphora_coffeaeformis.AAC.1
MSESERLTEEENPAGVGDENPAVRDEEHPPIEEAGAETPLNPDANWNSPGEGDRNVGDDGWTGGSFRC